MEDPIYQFVPSLKVDTVFLNIIGCPEFTRLHGIKQAGITGLFAERSYSRYEHSVGVYFLLKYLGASLPQCIGGLLHDIYHTNFSHTIDELFCGKNQESFHEKNKYVFFEKCCGNIKRILIETFPEISYTNFLDGPIMFITKNKSFGADMLDYFMRDGFYEKIFTKEWVNLLVSKLSINDDRIVLNDFQMSKYFLEKTIYINDHAYMSPLSRGQYCLFTYILARAISNGVIQPEQIIYGFNTDEEIYRKIRENCDTETMIQIVRLENSTEFSFSCDNDKIWKKISVEITRKLRYLNPICPKNEFEYDIVSANDPASTDLIKQKQLEYSKKEELYVKEDNS